MDVGKKRRTKLKGTESSATMNKTHRDVTAVYRVTRIDIDLTVML